MQAFPGMMLAIFNEDKNFTLLDSVRKKTDFLELVKSELALNNVEVINGRAEEIIKIEEKNMMWDFAEEFPIYLLF